ncbi:MAG TPA: 6,7-dimethyl-8-ribityllumazine synthase, partial [Anaerohalosphaeraceae bacterium]|nr:6,7-dimethyl-8-ribityllumazine synthase [Anaerohalosphaeraceae bacterium]
MAQELHGALQVGSERYGIVVSRFNEFITSKLLSGALDCLKRHGAKEDQITVLWVPGSFEVPVAAERLARSGKFAAVICLAAVIR